jgi:hypothetical protein
MAKGLKAVVVWPEGVELKRERYDSQRAFIEQL